MTSSQFSFNASLSHDALGKVSRLFNASLDDILNELLQNARRAGATQVTIDQLDDDKRGPMICFHDNGPGLSSCQDLFTLGSSGWHEDIIAAEDAGGMGFFSLANRGADIYVRKAGTHESWHMTVNPAAFSGTEPVTGDKGPRGFKGMSITFAQEAGDRVEAAVRKAARHAPVFVFLNGEMMESEDFLASANHIEDWQGIRIGVYRGHKPNLFSYSGDNANMHGISLRCPLPSLSQSYHASFTCRIDILSCAKLKLVLPARKEVVQNAFLRELQDQIRKIYYRLIAEDDQHSLSFSDYIIGRKLGIYLPEATRLLRPFSPAHADTDRNDFLSPIVVPVGAILFDGEGDSIEEQNLVHALSKGSDEDLRLFEPNSSFNGYHWYDALDCLSVKGYGLVCDGSKQVIKPDEKFEFQGRPDVLQVLVEQGSCTNIRERAFETDILVLADENDLLDDADIHVTGNSPIRPVDLGILLEDMLFNPSDDHEAGSYDQQLQWFSNEAEDITVTLLCSKMEADINAIKRAISSEVCCLVPNDKTITIVMKGRDIKISGLGAD